jgi:hypothetical protein
MVGLVDLKPFKKMVPVGPPGEQVEIEVSSVPAKFVADLLDRFPELRRIFGNREVRSEVLIKTGPDIVAAIIAAGTVGRVPGESDGDRHQRMLECQERAMELPLGDQLDLLSEIIAVTFPQGFLPFMRRLERLGLVAGSSASGGDPDTKLPSQFNGSFKQADIPPPTPGNTVPAS